MVKRHIIVIAFLGLFFQATYATQPDSLAFDYCHICRNQNKSFGRKFLQGSGLVFGYEGVALTILYASPKSFSKWDKPNPKRYRENLKRAFTQFPVVDEDEWYVNYLGHPYQGACFYNAIRSQGARIWQSALFVTGHSFAWEYLLEGGNEQPSIQDIFVTPLAGIILGEAVHQATIAMSQNGFKWYECMFVVVFNPMYAINNGFKVQKAVRFTP